jgi:hypothetical protein
MQYVGGATHALSHVSIDERERANILKRIARVERILNNSSAGSIAARIHEARD